MAPPTAAQLGIDVNRIARDLGVVEPTEAQQQVILDRVNDAIVDVEGYLHRPLVPRAVTRTGMYPRYGYDLTDWEAWADAVDFDEDYSVTSATVQPDGTYTVVFAVGIDASQIGAIKRYITVHAIESVRKDPAAGMGKLAVRSISVEGQSLGYESTSTKPGEAGQLPSLDSLDQWVLRPLLRKRGVGETAPWPYDGIPIGWNPR